MVHKTLSMFLSFLMITTGILPIRSTGAQEKKEYNIAVLDLDANGISSAEAKSLSNNMRAQIMRVINSKEFGKKTPIRFLVSRLEKNCPSGRQRLFKQSHSSMLSIVSNFSHERPLGRKNSILDSTEHFDVISL